MDPFAFHSRGVDSPATHHAAITPNNDADLPTRPRAIYCETGGTVALRDTAGTDLTYTVVAGAILPLSPVRVLATGTTATVRGWW